MILRRAVMVKIIKEFYKSSIRFSCNIMKFAVSLIFLFVFAACVKGDDNGMICDVWTGWTDMVLGGSCAATIIDTCVPLVTFFNDIKNAIRRFDSKYLKKAYEDLKKTINGFKQQFEICPYTTTLVNLIRDSAICIVKFKVSYEKVLAFVASAIYWVATGNYMTAGIILGTATRTFAECLETPQ